MGVDGGVTLQPKAERARSFKESDARSFTFIESEPMLRIPVLTRFLHAYRNPFRSKPL
jgi:hypothetical protein